MATKPLLLPVLQARNQEESFLFLQLLFHSLLYVVLFLGQILKFQSSWSCPIQVVSKALDLRIGNGESPLDGDVVAIHYYGRLAAKQGWRFDSTYDHKDETGEPIPFSFVLGSGKVISGIETAVRSMKVGGLRRVIIPPSQGYQNTSQEPLPPNYFDRQRLFTTIFNPTRLANGEGATLGTVIFDIELVSRRHL